MKYTDKLKDPRWQKKRLEVLSRDEFKCKSCGDDKSELQVHHMEKSEIPWDSPMRHLITLCKSCHALMHKLQWITPYHDELRLIILAWLQWEEDDFYEAYFESRKELNHG